MGRWQRVHRQTTSGQVSSWSRNMGIEIRQDPTVAAEELNGSEHDSILSLSCLPPKMGRVYIIVYGRFLKTQEPFQVLASRCFFVFATAPPPQCESGLPLFTTRGLLRRKRGDSSL